MVTGGSITRTYLHQVVVGSIQLLVELDHQALEEGRELFFLLARLETKGRAEFEQAEQFHQKSVGLRLCGHIVQR